MAEKSDLLKELGWSDNLIRHYMIDNTGFTAIDESQLMFEVYDSRTMTVTFNSDNQWLRTVN